MDKKSALLFSIFVSIILTISENLMIGTSKSSEFPTVLDESLVIQKTTDRLDKPSGFEFVGKQDILITQKDGEVKLIRNFDLKKYPLLDKSVFTHTQDRGLSGITSTDVGNNTYVFLFYTENDTNNWGKMSPYGNGNRIYRYVWDPGTLVLFNGTLVLDLPAVQNAPNSGGKIIVGPDSQLYTVIGDLSYEGRKQNIPKKDTSEDLLYDDKSGGTALLRTTIDGLPLSEKGFERSYGIGIRNSFGLAFDPVTGYLWDAEQGAGMLGEINIIKPTLSSDKCCTKDDFKLAQNTSILYGVNSSHFGEPNFVWRNSSSVSALVFMNSSALGNDYTNDVFVGDNRGNLYNFDLDRTRENIVIGDSLSAHIFATGFGSISDLKIGSDNALYVLTPGNNTGYSFEKDSGVLYRIAKNSIDLPLIESRAIAADYLWVISTLIITIAILIFLKYFKKYSGKVCLTKK
jgi:glucose/arabinose dehydrogenase